MTFPTGGHIIVRPISLSGATTRFRTLPEALRFVQDAMQGDGVIWILGRRLEVHAGQIQLPAQPAPPASAS